MIYAIGDIHGQLGLLKTAHDRIAQDMARHGHSDSMILHVGDLVDRGPDSAAVVAYLLDLHQNGANVMTLKGNHDRMFALFVRLGVEDPCLRKDLTWLHEKLGGRETLASYGLTPNELADPQRARAAAQQKVPPEHLAFLDGLPDRFESADHYFAHAGILPGRPFADQREDDLVWIRGPFLGDETPHPKKVVHGHSPVEMVENRANRIAIDTGAAYGGPLTTIGLSGAEVFELGPQGRAAIPAYAP